MHQHGVGGSRVQQRRQRAPGIAHRREGRHHQGQRRGHRLFALVIAPGRVHGHRVLAHRDGDAQLDAQRAHRRHRVVQCLVLPVPGRCRHPVGGQRHPAKIDDVGADQVGQRLGHRHAGGRGGIHQRQRRTFADGHGLAAVAAKAGRGDRDIGHRHLPRPDHRIAGDLAGHGTVGDGHQEGLVGHRGQRQHPFEHRFHRLVGQRQRRQRGATAGETSRHLRWMAEQHRHVEVDGRFDALAGRRRGRGQRVVQPQARCLGGLADHRVQAALAAAQGKKVIQPLRRHRQHVAFLGLVAPDLHGRHARLVAGHRAQVETAAAAGVVDQFRQGIGQAAGADVVDGQQRVGVAEGNAAVDHFLAAALHLRVATLYRGIVQRLAGRPGGNAGGGATAQADEHGRTAEDDDLRAGGNPLLGDVAGPDVAKTPGQHHRLVVAVDLAVGELELEAAEVAADVGPAELVVERGAAHRPLEHDGQRRGHARVASRRAFPRRRRVRQVQVGDREAGDAGLRLAAATGGALVANLAAGTGGGAGKRRDGGGMVMGFHLHQDGGVVVDEAVDAVGGIGQQPAPAQALDHRGIVLVGHQRGARMGGVGVADHAEQRRRRGFAVHRPVGVEDLVTAVLGVDLGEHHQLDVGGIAAEAPVVLHQVVDLVRGQGEALAFIGRLECPASAAEHVDAGQRRRLATGEQAGRGLSVQVHRLGHRVMQQGSGSGQSLVVGVVDGEAPKHAALDPAHALQSAVTGDVGGLGGPRRDGADPRRHQQSVAGAGRGCLAGMQQLAEQHLAVVAEGSFQVDEVAIVRGQPGQRGQHRGDPGLQPLQAEGGKGGDAVDLDHQRGQVGTRGTWMVTAALTRQAERRDDGPLPGRTPPPRRGRGGNGPCPASSASCRPTGDSHRG